MSGRYCLFFTIHNIIWSEPVLLPIIGITENPEEFHISLLYVGLSNLVIFRLLNMWHLYRIRRPKSSQHKSTYSGPSSCHIYLGIVLGAGAVLLAGEQLLFFVGLRL